ncbi:MAG: GspMb/PilO family protein [Candidatus Omnitrophica bacterium]|nr:GspMb/PilO family protein [Candidatus Omnitrophota bacterium]
MEQRVRNILRLECAGIILGVILVSVFDFYPKLRSAGELKKDIRLMRKKNMAISEADIEKQKASLREQLDRKRNDLTAIQQLVRQTRDKAMHIENTLLITQEMVNAASLSKIELASVKSKAAETKGKYKVLPVDTSFQCTYAELITFLSNLKASPVAWVVTGLSINRDENILPKLDIRMTASAVFAADEAVK